MKRHARLVPLSHDHHHALSEARRLQRATRDNGDATVEAARRFVRFFREETVRHFREEEELVFPLVVEGDVVPDLILKALAQHDSIHTQVQRVEEQLAANNLDEATLLELAGSLRDHVRFEERHLFPMIERTTDPARLESLALPSAPERH